MYSNRNSVRAFLGIVILAAVVASMMPSPLPAQDGGCIAVDRYDQPRQCTFLEEHGMCLVTALESYYQCKDEGGFFHDLGCYIAVQIDLFACNLSMPFKLLEPILR